jgi:uncharacterized GH25 family protein
VVSVDLDVVNKGGKMLAVWGTTSAPDRQPSSTLTVVPSTKSDLYTLTSAAAHDFWVQPNEYWLRPLALTSMTLQVGHGPFRQRSPIPVSRITRFEAIALDGTTIDLRGNLHLGGNTEDGDFRFLNAGAYVLVLETDDRAQSHLPAIRFNDYLKVERLTPALEQRERTHRMDADGSEKYSRQAKSIVQVGPPGAGSQAQVTKPLGLPLEIVPEESPYTEPRPATLPVRVIYEGRPLAWIKPLPSSRDTDFETIFSSLSFGFPASRPYENYAAERRPGALAMCTEHQNA